MTTTYHISKKGSPAICKARKDKCPLGGEDSHYFSWTEAQMASDRMNEKEHGLIPELKHKKASKSKDFEEISKRKEELINADPHGTNYISRCSSSVKLEKFKPIKSETRHFKKDRSDKNEGIEEMFGRGNLVGYYKVNQKVFNASRTQVIEIRDTGQIKIYDNKTNKLVTTLMAHKERIEVMLLNANEVPSSKWLNEIQKNKKKAREKGLD